ncbi:uncharacterized protein LOC108916579 [Anoplophora glabripennis]|uniref:uncharacterized protein LOC108916579 n=1 Tax=Anoplophora glabripennis TaxID=217634 RepID=UPI00087501B2|nr:uncharacterized protein LOC108916579 [Anoplophora glabripennis]
MTSTNINIGFSETRNSSRVLKPPGGGHTDIFGIREGNETQTPNKRKNHPPTTIDSCFVHNEPIKQNNTKNDVNEKEITNGNQNGVKTDVVDENTKPKEIKDIEVKENDEQKEAAAPPRRVRVPPGGFSSGLW